MHLFRGHAELGAEVVKENFVAYIILGTHGCLRGGTTYMTKLLLDVYLER